MRSKLGGKKEIFPGKGRLSDGLSDVPLILSEQHPSQGRSLCNAGFSFHRTRWGMFHLVNSSCIDVPDADVECALDSSFQIASLSFESTKAYKRYLYSITQRDRSSSLSFRGHSPLQNSPCLAASNLVSFSSDNQRGAIR